ncbi:MAG: phosphotransferase [Acidithiobacillus sp.]|uniref:phosphotransferase n=1 Tax=Acidithiobacillus sp. TaxID=1872118 RepID=UPI0025843BC8|nr:phosphotransferase [Acidithiobacillus sp.]MCE5421173.1 phosphotransferase [Acidithiobacillus sp.]
MLSRRDADRLQGATYWLRWHACSEPGDGGITAYVFTGDDQPVLFGRLAASASEYATRIRSEDVALARASSLQAGYRGVLVPKFCTAEYGGTTSLWQTIVGRRSLLADLGRGAGRASIGSLLAPVLEFVTACARRTGERGIEGVQFEALPAIAARLPDSTRASILSCAPDFERVLAAWPVTRCQHGDLWPGNLVIAPEGVAVVDWERYDMPRAAGYDLMFLLMHIACAVLGTPLERVTADDLAQAMEGRRGASTDLASLYRDFAGPCGIGAFDWRTSAAVVLMDAFRIQAGVDASASSRPSAYLRLAARLWHTAPAAPPRSP